MKKFWIVLDPDQDSIPRKRYETRKEAEDMARTLALDGWDPYVFQAISHARTVLPKVAIEVCR